MQPVIIIIIAVVIIFPIGLVFAIAKSRNKMARNRQRQRENTFNESPKKQARIIEVKRAEVGRSKKFELYKLLVEVQPFNSESAFSAVVIWEIEPAIVNLIQKGGLVPVKVNSADTREVFPDFAGAVFSYEYQHVYLGIENDIQPKRIVAVQNVAPLAPPPKLIYRSRSGTRLFGLPLWEVAFNLKKSRKRVAAAKARAIVAIGDSATGIIAIGTRAKGFISIGSLSLGVISFGSLSLGVFSYGVNAIGLVAMGFFAGGLLALGAGSGGYVSAGVLAFGKYVFSSEYKNPWMSGLYQNLKQLTGFNDDTIYQFLLGAVAINIAVSLLSLLVKAVVKSFLSPNTNSLESPPR